MLQYDLLSVRKFMYIWLSYVLINYTSKRTENSSSVFIQSDVSKHLSIATWN